MKKYIILLFLITSVSQVFSQTEFDKELNAISIDLSTKLQGLGKKKIVVLNVTDINKSQTTMGKYIADGVSVDIVNSPGSFQVFDRENLDAITGAKKLIAEGYLDAAKVKQLGELLSVDVIITGNYTLLSNTVRLTLKSLDANTGFVIAASARDLPLDADTRALLYGTDASPNSFSNNNKTPDTLTPNTEPEATTGTITVHNNINVSLQILLGTQTVEPANFGKQYFELTIASGKSDNYEGLAPGEYYLCAVTSRYAVQGCRYSKRIIVKAGKIAVVNIDSISSW